MGVKKIEKYKYRIKWRCKGYAPKQSTIVESLILACGYTNWRYIPYGKAYIKDDETLDRITDILLQLGYRVDISERPKGKWLYMVYNPKLNGTGNVKSYLAYLSEFTYNLYDLLILHMDEFTANSVRMSKKLKISTWKITNEMGAPPRMLSQMLYKLQDEGYLFILGKNMSHSKRCSYSIIYRVVLL